MFRLLSTLIALLLVPLALAQSQVYWPVLTPSPSNPWVVGQKNLLAWRMALGTGIKSFDIELHNWQSSVMEGAIHIALRVPVENIIGTYKNPGGEIEVDLDGNIPTGDGFVLVFMDKLHGQIYAKSDLFSIVAEPPSNFTDQPNGLPTATATATLHNLPDPTQGWALTLTGEVPATSTAS